MIDPGGRAGAGRARAPDPRREASLRELLDVLASVSHRAPVVEILSAIVAGLSRLFHDDCAAVRLRDGRDPAVTINAAYAGLAPELARAMDRLPIEEGIAGRAMLLNRVVVAEDYRKEFGSHRVALCSAMAAPIDDSHGVTGALVVASVDRPRRYDAVDTEILQLFATCAGVALADARAAETARATHLAQQAFMERMSHEFRTPLAVILGTLHLLSERRSELDPGVQDELIAAALQRGHTLSRMLSELLDAADPATFRGRASGPG